MKRSIKAMFAAVLMLAQCAGCASSINQDLEMARFALDRGDWNDAIAHAEAALASDPGCVQAALDLSSAYAGRSGFKALLLLAAIADEKRENDIFHAVRSAIGSSITNPEDLRTAILVLVQDLNPLPPDDDAYCLDYYFQLGVFMLVEGFGLPSMRAQPLSDGPIDVNNISEADRAVVQDDMAGSDEFLIEGGLPSDNDLVENNRQTYCALIKASAAPEGFDLAALRDMTLCQLSPNDGADLDPSAFQSPLIDSCSDFDYSLCEEAESL